GIREGGVTGTNQDRYVAQADVEALKQELSVGITLDVDVRIGMSVSAEKLARAKRGRRILRSQQHRVSNRVRDELDATQDERSHQDGADFGFALHERRHLTALEAHDLAAGPDPHLKQCATP